MGLIKGRRETLTPIRTLATIAIRNGGISVNWIYLIIAGILEWGWPLGLKFGWTEKGLSFWPMSGALISKIRSGYFLLMAQRTIPMGTAYAVWTGIGAVGTSILGIIFLDERAKVMRIVSVGFVVAGIVGLKVFS